MSTNVPVGPATVVGYILTALASAASAVAASENELAGPGKWLAILAIISGLTTNVGRQVQATKLPVEVLTTKPESAVTPDMPPV